MSELPVETRASEILKKFRTEHPEIFGPKPTKPITTEGLAAGMALIPPKTPAQVDGEIAGDRRLAERDADERLRRWHAAHDPKDGGNGYKAKAMSEEPRWLTEAPPPEEELTLTLPCTLREPVQGKVAQRPLRRRNAEELRKSALSTDRPALQYLPFLGLEGYIVRGWSHLIPGYPKAGKTELITRLCGEWKSERILFFTEEPETVWEVRLASLPGGWGHMEIVFALGIEPEGILAEIQGSQDSVIVIDTVRNLLAIQDENDNSEVARVLNPYIVACRGKGATLILAHHLRKRGGEHGEGITGGHAFLGVVDIALEIGFADSNPERRKVTGRGRILSIPELIYEQREDKSFAPLGSPADVTLREVKGRALEVLNGEWQPLKEIHAALAEPKPSLEQLRNGLSSLIVEGRILRDPAESKPGVTYKYRLESGATLPCTGLLKIQGKVAGEELRLPEDPYPEDSLFEVGATLGERSA